MTQRRFSNSTDIDFKPRINSQGHYLCLMCEKDLAFDRRRVRFCSDDCRRKYLNKFTWWADLRLLCFERDKWTCRSCGIEVYDLCYHNPASKMYGYYLVPNGQWAECDHIIPIFLGGADLDLDNLQTLCDDCHKKKSVEEAKQRTKIKSLVRNGIQKTLIATCG